MQQPGNTETTTMHERRQQPDRRQQTTSLLEILRWQGRRTGGRRQGESANIYVDCPTPRIVRLVLFVSICSALDALFTLLYLQYGGSEANPLMAVVLHQGTTSFVGLKMGLTGIGTLILAMHQHFWLGLQGLYFLALAYTSLLAFHVFLFLGAF
jgi:hypothetical protein